MTFFSRPDLSNVQFKQLSGSTLTLEGNIQIANVTGLTIINDYGDYIPIIVTGATNFDVLTYCNGRITLEPSSGGGSGTYSGASPTTCAVGGMPVDTNIYGQSISSILQCILVPTVDPDVVEPYSTFSIIPTTATYEVGCSVSIIGTLALNRGSITPQYTSGGTVCSPSCCRVGAATCYNFTYLGLSCNGVVSGCAFTPALCVHPASNSMSGCVFYASGATAAYKSNGDLLYPAKPSGCTTSTSIAISGIYPWFWGSSTGVPNLSSQATTQALLGTYTCKCVATSTSTITVTNFNVSGKYIWLAVPYASTVKTKWQDITNPSNNGVIPGTLFPGITSCYVCSPQNCWGNNVAAGSSSPICYSFYVSSYATSVNYGISFCN